MLVVSFSYEWCLIVWASSLLFILLSFPKVSCHIWFKGMWWLLTNVPVVLFSLAGAIIRFALLYFGCPSSMDILIIRIHSPKFFRKITYLDTLSDLAYHVPLTQIDIPPAVYKYASFSLPIFFRCWIRSYYRENLKHEEHINLPTPFRSNMFGVPLEELMGYDGEKDGLPRVVRDCIQFLRETGKFLTECF